MPYDEELAQRLRALLADEPGIGEQRMFGGLAFLVDGRMAVAAAGGAGMMVRCAPEETAALLTEPGTRPMEMRGRELPGWLVVDPEGCASPHDLERWTRIGVDHARTLPPK